MEIQKFDLPPGTQTQLSDQMVDGRYGWRLIAIVPFEGTVMQQEEHKDQHGYNSYKAVPREVKTVRFLFARDESAAIQEADGRTEEARAQVRELQNKLEASEETSKTSIKELGVATRDVERLKGNLVITERHLERAVENSRKMECDIGKLREALGDIRMKEILGQ